VFFVISLIYTKMFKYHRKVSALSCVGNGGDGVKPSFGTSFLAPVFVTWFTKFSGCISNGMKLINA
jgi:hypothetical protein